MPARPPKSKKVVLRLPSALLAPFSTPDAESKPSPARTPAASSAAPAHKDAAEAAPSSSSANTAADANTAQAANGAAAEADSAAPTVTTLKRKGVPGPKAGTKRSAATALDSVLKGRAKPGPKKKARLGNLVNDPLAKGPFGPPAPLHHRLGPKANQGAINAGLRALDRSGKPCRKWERRAFTVKSFTGVEWGVRTWRAPKRAPVAADGEPKDAKTESTGSSDVKAKEESSAVSDKSHGAANASTPLPAPPTAPQTPPAPAAPAA